MKATHQSKLGAHEDVTAWQFSHTTPIPVWVARRFHLTGGENWKAIAGEELITAKPGDWAIIVWDKIIVLSNNEFNQCFQPLP